MHLFTSESVSEGHPDKICDQISDTLLDTYLALDPQSHVAVETMATRGQVIVAGEVRSRGVVNVEEVVRERVRSIGYTDEALGFAADSVGVLSAIHRQSDDIARGVYESEIHEQGAGDQGMMFGYATDETPGYLPATLWLAHRIMRELAAIRHEGKQMTYLRPDAKSQVTARYDGRHVDGIEAIVLSTQHAEFGSDEAMAQQIRSDVEHILIPRVVGTITDARLAAMLLHDKYRLFVNPTGRFVTGGPQGDTGLTGRKIIVDTYGGRGAHGGGAFSGKDPSKVDRSAAYMARYIAKNLVAAGAASEALVQLSYAIGVADPVSVCVDTRGTGRVSDDILSKYVMREFDMRPGEIERLFDLRTPIYAETACYGHVGRECRKVTKRIETLRGETALRDVTLFPWERTDRVEKIKSDLT